jgi:hypothetical protein
MKKYAFARGATVTVPGLSVSGTITGRAEHSQHENLYQIEWINPEGSHSRQQFGEAAVVAAQKRVRRVRVKRKSKPTTVAAAK